jgi:hypothetical protein
MKVGARCAAARRIALLALVLAFAAGGCGRKRRSPAQTPQTKPPETQIQVQMTEAKFTVEDGQGRLLMVAKPKRSVGVVSGSGSPEKGPITFTEPDCTMYKEGKPEMIIRAPEAVWQDGRLTASKGAHIEMVDGSMKADAQRAQWENQVITMYQMAALLSKNGQPQLRLTAPEAVAKGDLLSAEKTMHAETPDGVTRLDARKAVWDRKSSRLTMQEANGQQFEKGKQTVAAQGSRVEYQDHWLTLPAGGMARRLLDKTAVRADHIRWNQTTGQVEAAGHVVLEAPQMRAEGAKFVGNTTLKKGRLTGRPRMHIYRRRV